MNLEIDQKFLFKRIEERLVCCVCSSSFSKNNYLLDDDCLECGDGKLIIRDDDNSDVLKKRLGCYNEKCEEILSYYKTFGCVNVINIDATGSVKDIFDFIVRSIA